MKKILVVLSFLTLAFVVLFSFELAPHIKSAKSISREISSLEKEAKYYTDVLQWPEDAFDKLIDTAKNNHKEEVSSIVRLSSMILVFSIADAISVGFMFSHCRERESDKQTRRLARQEKKRAALEEKQKSIQDELDRMK